MYLGLGAHLLHWGPECRPVVQETVIAGFREAHHPLTVTWSLDTLPDPILPADVLDYGGG